MELECKKIAHTLDIPNTGGKVFCRDINTVLLIDCEFLSDKHMLSLQKALPYLKMDVVSCEQSVSGFMVVFTRPATNMQLIMQCAHVTLCAGVLLISMLNMFEMS